MAGIGPGEDDDHFEAYERERGAVAQACDEIDELRAQVEANRARYESARRERDTMAAVIRGVAQNFRRLGQHREAAGLLALAGLGA